MKKLTGLLVFSVVMIGLCLTSYAMGGAPAPAPQPEQPQPLTQQQIQVQQAGNTQPQPQEQVTTQQNTPNRVDELEKVRAQVKQERTDLSKLQTFIWNLDTKMVSARRTKNMKKLMELKEQEQDAVYKARLLENSISQKMEMYPELKVSEAIEAQKTAPAKPKTEVIYAEQASTVMAQPVVQQPKATTQIVYVQPETQQVQSQPVQQEGGSTIVYHEVQIGDTFYSISRKYFGTPSLYKQIAVANGFTDLKGLQQGMQLKIDMRWKSMVPVKPVNNPAL